LRKRKTYAQTIDEGMPIDTLDLADGEIIQPLYPYGIGIDCHRSFIEVCVFVRTSDSIRKYENTYSTGWKTLGDARDWARTIIRIKSSPTIEPDVLRYTIESTSTYHMPIIKAWGGNPCVVNPLLASPTRRKTDKLDARLMAYQSMTGLWPASFIADPETQAFRLLMKQRQDAGRAAVAITNRINNYLLRFGHTIGATGSVRGYTARAIIEDMCRDDFEYTDGKYAGLIEGDYICPAGLPDDVKTLINGMWEEFDRQKAIETEFHKKGPGQSKAHDVADPGRRNKGRHPYKKPDDCPECWRNNRIDLACGSRNAFAFQGQRKTYCILRVRSVTKDIRRQSHLTNASRREYQASLSTRESRRLVHQPP